MAIGFVYEDFAMELLSQSSGHISTAATFNLLNICPMTEVTYNFD